MAQEKISGLPAAATLTGSELVESVQGGNSVRTTTQDIADLAAGPTYPTTIPQGGTGQTTAQAALDALFASVAKGSIWTGDGANITPVAVGSDGKVLTADSGAANGVSWQTIATGIAIGEPIGGATAGRLLFAGAGPVLAQDANLFFDVSLGALQVKAAVGTQFPIEGSSGIYGTSIGSDTLCLYGVNSSGCIVQLGNAGVAFQVTDGVRTISICDGTNNVLYGPGTPANWSAAPPTDVWLALDRIVQWIQTNFPVPPPP